MLVIEFTVTMRAYQLKGENILLLNQDRYHASLTILGRPGIQKRAVICLSK
jgi:hypothetical protein